MKLVSFHTGFTYISAGIFRSTGNSYSFCADTSAGQLDAVDRLISSTLLESAPGCSSRWARLRIKKKSPAARAMPSGIPNPAPKAIVCDLFLLLDEVCDVRDDDDDDDDSGKPVGVTVVEDEMMVV